MNLCRKDYSIINYNDTNYSFSRSCKIFNYKKCQAAFENNNFQFWTIFSLIAIIAFVVFAGYFSYRYYNQFNFYLGNLIKGKISAFNPGKHGFSVDQSSNYFKENILNKPIKQIKSIEFVQSKLTGLEQSPQLSLNELAKLKQFEENWLYPLDASKDTIKFVRYYDHRGFLIKRPKNLHDLEKQEISMKYYRRQAVNGKEIFIFEGPTSSKSPPERPMVFQFENFY